MAADQSVRKPPPDQNLPGSPGFNAGKGDPHSPDGQQACSQQDAPRLETPVEHARIRSLERALWQADQRLEALLELGRMEDASLDAIIEFALEQGVRLTASSVGYLAFTNDDETILSMHAWSREAMQNCQMVEKPIDYQVAETGLWGNAVRQRQPVIYNDDPSADPHRKGFPAGHIEMTRHMHIPVMDGDHIVAVAGVGNKPEDYDETDVRQLSLMMTGMWQIVRHKRVMEEIQRDLVELKRRERIQAAVFKISQAAISAETLHALYQSVHAILGELMPVENFFIALQDRTTGWLTYPYFVDQFDPPPAGRENIGKGLTAYVLRNGKPLLASPEVFEELVIHGYVEAVGAPSIDWLGVPLIGKDGVIGVLAVQSYTEGIRFGLEEQDIMQFVSNQIALVIERMQAEMVLRSSESRYRGIVQDQTELICRWKEDGILTFANDAYIRYLGVSSDDILGTDILALILEADRDEYRQHLNRVRAGEPPIPYIVRTRLAAGQVNWEQWTDRALYDQNGQFIEYQSVGRDVSSERQREDELEAIVSVSAAMRTASTRADMLPVILDQLVNLLRLEGAALAIRDPLQEELEFELGRGVWAPLLGRRVSAYRGIFGDVIQNGELVFTDPRSDGDRFPDLPEMGGVSAAACMPLRVNEETHGLLWLGKNDPFTERDMHLLAAVADIAANAIYRATLHEQTQLRLQRLSALQAIDMAVSSSLDVRVTMTILLDQVTLQLGAAAADILQLNAHTQSLEFAAGRGFYSHLIQATSLRIGQGHAGAAALDRRIVSVTDLNEVKDASRHQALLGENFTSYTAVPLIAKGQVKGVLELFYRKPVRVDPEWLDFLQSLGANAAIALDNAELFDKLQRSNVELSLAYDSTIEGWSRALELRDRETEGHTQRVADMTIRLARLIGVPDSDFVHMRRGALLHDIGKMAIPDPILLKTGPLTENEWEIMQKHPVYAYNLLSPIPYLRPALDIPYYHHEKWDGSGYPNGLREEQIPLAARIFSIIDVWDALRSDRPYRPAWSYERSLEYIRSHTGINFDPQVVVAFLRMLAEE
jgi:PAS domain S-box-containing protein